MRKLLTIIITFLCSLTNGQNNISCFEWSGGNQTDWFCFQDSSFRHINKTHESYCYGEGILNETGDSLVFNYINLKKDYLIKRSSNSDSDSLEITFQIIEGIINNPIENASVFIERIRIGKTSDTNGNGKLSMDKNQLNYSDKLKIQAVGLPYKTIKLTDLLSYEKVDLKIWLSDEIGFFNQDDAASYLLVDKSKNNLQMQNEYGYVYKFKKISLRRFEKILTESKMEKLN